MQLDHPESYIHLEPIIVIRCELGNEMFCSVYLSLRLESHLWSWDMESTSSEWHRSWNGNDGFWGRQKWNLRKQANTTIHIIHSFSEPCRQQTVFLRTVRENLKKKIKHSSFPRCLYIYYGKGGAKLTTMIKLEMMWNKSGTTIEVGKIITFLEE